MSANNFRKEVDLKRKITYHQSNKITEYILCKIQKNHQTNLAEETMI